MSFSNTPELRESFVEIATSEQNFTLSNYKGFTIERNSTSHEIYYNGDKIDEVHDPEEIIRWFIYKEKYKTQLERGYNLQDALSVNGWKYSTGKDTVNFDHKWVTPLDEHTVEITHSINGFQVNSPSGLNSVHSVSPKAALIVAIDAISQTPAHEVDYNQRVEKLAKQEFEKLEGVGGSRSNYLVRNDITTFEELIDAPNYKLPDKVPAKALKKRAKEYLEENERDIDETPQIREVSSYYVSRSI